MSILSKILEWVVMPLYDVLMAPAIEEEARQIERVKARIERINVERRKRGEPDLIVIGDSFPPYIVEAEDGECSTC